MVNGETPQDQSSRIGKGYKGMYAVWELRGTMMKSWGQWSPEEKEGGE